jgi:hypothetical protein
MTLNSMAWTNPLTLLKAGCAHYKKKGEREFIENYWPITLLNTDDKLFTKVLAIKLARCATTLIHPSQAGFILGRQISNQTKLIQMVMDYAEAAEVNGMIVVLDQEKVDDRVRHDYLWSILEAFGLLERFISSVKELYKCESTRVMINGVLSAPFKVYCGV